MITEKLAFIDDDSNERLSRSQLQADDVLFSIAGAIGRTYLVSETDLPANTNQAFAIVRFKQSSLLPGFGYYAMRDKRFQGEAMGKVVQTAQPNVNLTQLSNSSISVPPLEIQKRITSILSTYDDLIDNNRRRIELLEQEACLLYKEWFVNLRFPGHEHTKITNSIPEGWDKGTVADFGKVITGKTPSTKGTDNYGKDVPFIKTPDMHSSSVIINTEQHLSEKGANTQKKKTIPPYSILMACIGAKLGVVSLNAVKAQTNQQINSIIPKYHELAPFCYFTMEALKPNLIALSSSSTMPNVNKTKFESLTVVFPKESLVKAFYSIVFSNIEQITTLTKQNQKLAEARDLLLPRLMNGGIIV